MNKTTDGKKQAGKLPTDDAALKALDTRLGQEMARCARDYDDARTHLAAHHVKMSQQEAALVKHIAALQPQVDGLLDGTGPGLTKAVAQACLKYLDLNAQLHTTRQGKRLAYGATVPAGAQRLGGAMGDPSPNSVPSDIAENMQKGISLSLISKGVTLPAGYRASVPDYDDGYGKVEVHHGGKSVGALHFHQVYKENARGIAVKPDTAHVDLITIHKDHRGKGLSTAMYAHLKKHLNLQHPEVKTLTGRIENPIALRARASALGAASSLHSVGGASPEPLDEAGAHRVLGGKRVGGSKPSVMVSHVLKGVKVALLFKALRHDISQVKVPYHYYHSTALGGTVGYVASNLPSGHIIERDGLTPKSHRFNVAMHVNRQRDKKKEDSRYYRSKATAETFGAKPYSTPADIADEDEHGIPGGTHKRSLRSDSNLYHVTDSLHLPSIHAVGLTPGLRKTQRDETPDMKRHGAGKHLYAADNKDIIGGLERDNRNSTTTLLRFKKGSRPFSADPEYMNGDHGAWRTNQTVPPHEIESWSGHHWQPLSPKTLKAIEGGNFDRGGPSYLTDKPGRMAAPKRAVFAEGLPRAAATAAVHAGLSHVSSDITGISTRQHTFQSQSPAEAVSHLSSSLSGAGYKHTSAEHIPDGGIKAKFTDPASNTHTFHIQHSAAVPFKPPVRDAPGPVPLKMPSIPKLSLPKFKMSVPKMSVPQGSGFKSPSAKPAPKQTPNAPVNHLDSGALAAGIGGHLHDVQSRTTRPLFGKGQEQHAHLLSHAQPKNAIHDLHQQLSQGPGRTGAITEQRVPHASGGMGHLYSFEHHAEDGTKHIIHMMRSAPTGRRTGGGRATRNAAEPKPTPEPKAAAGKSAETSAPGAKPYSPATAQAADAFTHGFIQHHAKQGTLPDKPAAVEKMRDAAWEAHKKQFPHEHNAA